MRRNAVAAAVVGGDGFSGSRRTAALDPSEKKFPNLCIKGMQSKIYQGDEENEAPAGSSTSYFFERKHGVEN